MPLSDEARTKTMKTFLFGWPLARSYSPFLHNNLYRLAGVPRTYTKWEGKDIQELVAATKADDFAGSAVTMPYKVAITKHCDGLTEEGKAIGACNTIYWENQPDGSRKLIGHNTDCIGIRESFMLDDPSAGSGPSRPGMIVGGGGASRAAVYALAVYLQCSPIYVVNRDDAEVDAMLADFKQHATPQFNPEMIHVRTPEQAASVPTPAYIVSAIPCFPPATPEEKRARATLEVILDKPEKGAFLEMCYHPHLWTDICTIGREKGWRMITGDVPMIWQGIEQQKIWLNCTADELPVQEIVELVRKQIESDQETHAAPPDM